MAQERERLKILQQIKQAKAELKSLEDKTNELSKEELKLKERILETIVSSASDLKKLNKERLAEQNKTLSYLSDEESKLSSLSDMQHGLKKIGEDRLEIVKQISLSDTKLNSNSRNSLSTITDLTTKLSTLNRDDYYQRLLLQREIDSEIDSLQEQAGVTSELIDNVKAQFEISKSLSYLTEKEKNTLSAQLDVYNKINNTISGTLQTAGTLFRKPIAMVGSFVFALGTVADKVGMVNRELGQSITQLDTASVSAAGLSFIFDDAVGTLKGITNEFGNIEKATLRVQTSTNLIATNMGISAGEASQLIGSFSRLNDGSTEIAADMVKTTQQFAKQNKVIPSDVMSDLAGSAEQFALFGEKGGENLIKAAVGARQLGTNLQTVTGIADNLLDFESSITKELELGAMLGRTINLTRARGLAYEGDINGALQETLKQLGGIEEFNRMDYFQKKQTADLLGVSVAELQKMAKNQENLGTSGAMIQEKFSVIGESLNTITNKYLGTGLKGLGGWLTTLGQINMGLSAVGLNLKGAVSWVASGLKKLILWPVNLIKAKVASKSLASTPAFEGALVGRDKRGRFTSLAKKGANTGKGFGSSIGSVGRGMGAGMKGLAVGFRAFTAPQVIGGLAVVTAALIGLGFALKLAAPGIKAVGDAIGTIIESIATGIGTVVRSLGDFGTQLGNMANVETIGNILLLSGAITTLSISMAALAATSLLALPAIGAISAVGAVSGFVGDTLESAGIVEAQSVDNKKEEQLMLQELKGLRADLQAGKIAVYMDSKKVTTEVATVANRSTTNSGNNIFGG